MPHTPTTKQMRAIFEFFVATNLSRAGIAVSVGDVHRALEKKGVLQPDFGDVEAEKAYVLSILRGASDLGALRQLADNLFMLNNKLNHGEVWNLLVLDMPKATVTAETTETAETAQVAGDGEGVADRVRVKAILRFLSERKCVGIGAVRRMLVTNEFLAAEMSLNDAMTKTLGLLMACTLSGAVRLLPNRTFKWDDNYTVEEADAKILSISACMNKEPQHKAASETGGNGGNNNGNNGNNGSNSNNNNNGNDGNDGGDAGGAADFRPSSRPSAAKFVRQMREDPRSMLFRLNVNAMCRAFKRARTALSQLIEMCQAARPPTSTDLAEAITHAQFLCDDCGLDAQENSPLGRFMTVIPSFHPRGGLRNSMFADDVADANTDVANAYVLVSTLRAAHESQSMDRRHPVTAATQTAQRDLLGHLENICIT